MHEWKAMQKEMQRSQISSSCSCEMCWLFHFAFISAYSEIFGQKYSNISLRKFFIQESVLQFADFQGFPLIPLIHWNYKIMKSESGKIYIFQRT